MPPDRQVFETVPKSHAAILPSADRESAHSLNGALM
jgi:hypothetical protein